MPPDSSVVVHVPFGYPTALFFVDESSVKASAGRFFVVGAIKLRRPGHLMRAIADIRDRYEFRGEFKFSNITRGSFAMCCELIDAIHCSDARISACVVDRATGRDPFQGNTPLWLAHAQVTTAFLAGNVNRRELAAALVDHVSTPKGSAFDDTVRNMVNRRLRSTSLVSVACAVSESTDGVQLVQSLTIAVRRTIPPVRPHTRERSRPGSPPPSMWRASPGIPEMIGYISRPFAPSSTKWKQKRVELGT